jgi:hypothetical protein
MLLEAKNRDTIPKIKDWQKQQHSPPCRQARLYDKRRFVVDAADLQAIVRLGLLRLSLLINTSGLSVEDYGVACDSQRSVGVDVYAFRAALRSQWNTLAQAGGFQIYVHISSVKPGDSGNAKFGCKKLHGLQYFDTDTPADSLSCSFFINMYGKNGEWKITKANLAHNHVKHIGFTTAPRADGRLPMPAKSLRNTAQELDKLTTIVGEEMLSAHHCSTASMSGKAVQSLLKDKGVDVSLSTVSRIKAAIDRELKGDVRMSYQKLVAYLQLVAGKNTGSSWKFERAPDCSTFFRACFVPIAGVHAALMARRLIGFDGVHLKGDMHQLGVFLVATAKDFDNHIVPFALALVPVENYDSWCWFMAVVKGASRLDKFTVLSDRQKDLVAALANVSPSAGHRYCLRHIMDNISRSGVSLGKEGRGFICHLARSNCENDYTLYRKELVQVKAGAVKYLDKLERCRWVKYAFQEKFKLPTYNEITSSLSEQANHWMGNTTRSARPLNAFHLYFRKLGKLFSDKRHTAAEWIRLREPDALVSAQQKKMAERAEASKACADVSPMEGTYLLCSVSDRASSGWLRLSVATRQLAGQRMHLWQPARRGVSLHSYHPGC